MDRAAAVDEIKAALSLHGAEWSFTRDRLFAAGAALVEVHQRRTSAEAISVHLTHIDIAGEIEFLFTAVVKARVRGGREKLAVTETDLSRWPGELDCLLVVGALANAAGDDGIRLAFVIGAEIARVGHGE